MDRLFSRRAPKRAGKFLPQLEALEDRALLACSVTTLPGGILKIEGDAAADKVKIVDSSGLGGGSVSVKCGSQTTTATGIKAIQVFTKGGKDSVEYELHSTTLPLIGTLQVSRQVTVNLGKDDDKFTAKMAATLVKGSNVRLDVFGATGKDAIKLVAGGFLNDGAVLRMNAFGGNDADNIKLAYNGDMDGTLNLQLDGEGGNDKVAADLNTSFFVAKGDGVVGEVGNAAQVTGGAGNDRLRFRVNGPHLAGVFAQIHGDSGKDVGKHTVNVKSFNDLESDFVMP